ncbi:MAG: DUF6114 domain-containing protein [Brevibacterium aurantiacum]|uniref:Putative membrane protein n=1 Tax=Brevibacterium aurantiacum TaxID=273384 RepID=A0A2H1HSS3_BREAU|nr:MULTISPECIES: DUF6114 domain-containing protein [Brevibacterium]MDN5594132.1 DUF6114 domain-containing protein [Brevibacterium sp.]AOP51805.1 putative membrane protein [Brevibacterium aurantiacum]MDN5609102.1 DUF6114 domain-containing protein [Brevibacterium sp.]MDN5711224.1 DUF6114 domain-containing protein [Brevibacterium aurantiacum]MDN5735293.1 DUF6114 domain-containing protein [Brevibacterium aurantiacum]
MKEAAINDQQTDRQEDSVQRTNLLALSRRSRRNSERVEAQPESTVETAEFAAATSGRDDANREDATNEAAGHEATGSEAAGHEAADREDAASEDAAREGTGRKGTGREDAPKRHRFRNWRRQRPFIGGVLAVLGGVELFFSGQLDTGNLQVQFGIEGLQATVIPIALVVLGLLSMFRPTHHVFYGIIALVLSVYSLIGVNLGGFILGMLLSSIGSILIVAWMGPRKPKSDAPSSDAQAPAAGRREDTQSAGEEGVA